MSALSTEVLAPGIDGDSAQADRSQPLLDQYRKNPALVHQRYLLVLTWMHATKIFKAIGKESMPKGQLINSASLKEVPAENRVDGWGKPYCILVDSSQMTFLSSDGNGAANCEKVREIARQAALKANDSRLTREGNMLAMVLRRTGDVYVKRLDPQ